MYERGKAEELYPCVPLSIFEILIQAKKEKSSALPYFSNLEWIFFTVLVFFSHFFILKSHGERDLRCLPIKLASEKPLKQILLLSVSN